MEKALFALRDILFSEIHIESHNLPSDDKISIDFQPSCEIDLGNNESRLQIRFRAFSESESNKSDFINLSLVSIFEFSELTKREDVPDYYFKNALAMVYPYIRSFVTSILAQANLERKIILPTMNLSGLSEELSENTKYIS